LLNSLLKIGSSHYRKNNVRMELPVRTQQLVAEVSDVLTVLRVLERPTIRFPCGCRVATIFRSPPIYYKRCPQTTIIYAYVLIQLTYTVILYTTSQGVHNTDIQDDFLRMFILFLWLNYAYIIVQIFEVLKYTWRTFFESLNFFVTLEDDLVTIQTSVISTIIKIKTIYRLKYLFYGSISAFKKKFARSF